MARSPRNPWGRSTWSGRSVNAAKPEWQKNPSQASSNRSLAIEAIERGVCLSVRYHNCDRVVEVHIGRSAADRGMMSVYQVDGRCNETTIPGWARFCFDECFNVALTEQLSSAPRPDYKSGAKQFRAIEREV